MRAPRINDEDLPALGSVRRLAPSAACPVILDPARRMTPLPSDGAMVTINAYWIRRLRDGGAVDKTAPAPAATKPRPAAEKESA